MKVEQPSQPGASQPPVARWLVWAVLILIGGTVVVPLVAALITAAADGEDTGKLPWLLAIVIYVVLFFCLEAAFHPIRGRTDEKYSWKEQFPTHADQEIQRFLQVVVGSLGLGEKHLCKLRPDDRVRDLTQEAFCGDGMDIVELIMAIEEEYALELPDSFLEKARTLGDLFDYVSRHRTGHPPTPDSTILGPAKTG
jgi:acyl carrier protein